MLDVQSSWRWYFGWYFCVGHPSSPCEHNSEGLSKTSARKIIFYFIKSLRLDFNFVVYFELLISLGNLKMKRNQGGLRWVNSINKPLPCLSRRKHSTFAQDFKVTMRHFLIFLDKIHYLAEKPIILLHSGQVQNFIKFCSVYQHQHRELVSFNFYCYC